MQRKFHKKAFTLIEMLIVIVIIGVLAAALIPRLTSVRDRANDVARKADLNQLATAIIARQMDHNGNLPGSDGGLLNMSDIATELKDAGLDSIPTDPKADTQVSGLGTGFDNVTINPQYAYMKITKNGIPNSAFAVMAKMETPGASNWLFDAALNTGLISPGLDSSSLLPCKSISKGATAADFALVPGGDCVFTDLAQLRFFIIR